MSIRILKIYLIAILVVLPGLLLADKNEDPLFWVIQERNEQYMRLYLADDAAGLTKLHTRDATVIAPNYGPVKGHLEIQAGLAEELAIGDGWIKLKALEVTRVADDTAYEIGHYKLKIDLPNGEAISDEGNTVVIWKLGEDDVWRLHVDIWNTNLPQR